MGIDGVAEVSWRDSAAYQLVSVSVVGILLLVVAHMKLVPVSPFWLELVAELGRALLVAGILGALIDGALKKDLIGDAVSAALGYLLPDELKNELTWIYGQEVIASQDFYVRLEHLPEEHVVILHGNVRRKLTNKSGKEIRVQVQGGIDEWFVLGRESVLQSCKYVQYDKATGKQTETQVPSRRVPHGVIYGLAEVPLGPGESIDVVFSYSMPQPSHGMEALTFRYPVLEPTVTVEAPETLIASVTFSHRTRYRDESAAVSGVITRRLPGILLPHQDIRVYWYDKGAYDARAAALS